MFLIFPLEDLKTGLLKVTADLAKKKNGGGNVMQRAKVNIDMNIKQYKWKNKESYFCL